MKQQVTPPLKSNNATKASNLALSGFPRPKVSWSGAEVSASMTSYSGARQPRFRSQETAWQRDNKPRMRPAGS